MTFFLESLFNCLCHSKTCAPWSWGRPPRRPGAAARPARGPAAAAVHCGLGVWKGEGVDLSYMERRVSYRKDFVLFCVRLNRS